MCYVPVCNRQLIYKKGWTVLLTTTVASSVATFSCDNYWSTMLALIISAVLISIASHVECTSPSGYQHYHEAFGSLKLYKEPTNWNQAFLKCYNDSAVLASPLDEGLLSAMQDMMEKHNAKLSYFIGANAKYTSGLYVSIEGVPLTQMPAGQMYDELDKQQGECLGMSGYTLKAVSCKNPLPYLCYKKDSECGTTDKQYKLQPSTGSCYKLHKELKNWRDANSVCISEGGYLAILNNDLEARMLMNMIPENTGTWPHEQGWRGMYIGLHDWTHSGNWLTNNAKPLTKLFRNWDSTQPDSKSLANCAVINRREKLDNIWCHYLAPFICEKDPNNIIYSQEHPDHTSRY